jgi:predicted enzyme related to lactoylglutathione lyase
MRWSSRVVDPQPVKASGPPASYTTSADSNMIHQVKAAGGEIVGEKLPVPGIGDTIYAKDTEGNTFGMIQPLPGSALQP